MAWLATICLLAAILQSSRTVAPLLSANFSAPNVTQVMLLNNNAMADFTLNTPFFDCSLQPLFTYFQTDAELAANTPTLLTITTALPAQAALTTKYNLLSPTLSSNTCSPPGCQLSISNNCEEPIHYLNYFDVLEVTLSSGNTSFTLSYFVYCKESYSQNTLEWGLILEILLVTVMIAVVALYSNPWSLGGRGIEVNYWLLALFLGLMAIGAVIGLFSYTAITICLYVLSCLLGILGVATCTNEVLFLLRVHLLRRVVVRVGGFEVRVMECVSVGAGVAATAAWFFSGNNIILNDLLSICMCVALIKVLKFTSLKVAGVTFLVVIAFELAVVVALYLKVGQSYNNLFLNEYNFPLELQFPTLNPTYNQKCAWLPITAVVFPGMLLSYLRRFDSSRNTRVYLVTATVLFLLGGIAWVFVNIPAPVTFPFGLISEPCMFGLVCVFAYQRREIRVIWSGEFYDEEFANQKELKVIVEMIDQSAADPDDPERRSTIDHKLIDELKASSGNNSSRVSDENVVRSKFLRL